MTLQASNTQPESRRQSVPDAIARREKTSMEKIAVPRKPTHASASGGRVTESPATPGRSSGVVGHAITVKVRTGHRPIEVTAAVQRHLASGGQTRATPLSVVPESAAGRQRGTWLQADPAPGGPALQPAVCERRRDDSRSLRRRATGRERPTAARADRSMVRSVPPSSTDGHRSCGPAARLGHSRGCRTSQTHSARNARYGGLDPSAHAATIPRRIPLVPSLARNPRRGAQR